MRHVCDKNIQGAVRHVGWKSVAEMRARPELKPTLALTLALNAALAPTSTRTQALGATVTGICSTANVDYVKSLKALARSHPTQS